MSRRIMLSAESKSAWASARDSSVLPTPVGPRKMNEPIGGWVLDAGAVADAGVATSWTASS
jgi:hypothetical protein